MWFAIIFWGVILLGWFLASNRSKYENLVYRIEIELEYDTIKKKPISNLKLFEMTELAICSKKAGSINVSQKIYEDLEQEHPKILSRKITQKICKWIYAFYARHPKKANTGLYFCAITKYIICYPLTTAFALSAFFSVWAYIYVRHYVWYLPLFELFLFYAIPLALFGLSMIIYCKIRRDLNWSITHMCFIFAFWISFGLSFVLYDWTNAKAKYEAEMEDLFGEDWEEEIEELESEENLGRR